ncbi:Chalcone isomerase-like protein 1, partial [Linum grandiflorum]
MAATVENNANVDNNNHPTTPLEEKLNGLALKDPAANGKPLEKTSETPTDQAPMEEPQKAVAVAEEEIAVEIEPKTGISFPVKLADGKQLMSVGLRKKSLLGMGIKIYSFGMYSDSEKLKENLKAKIATKPSKEMYQAVIDDDSAMTVRLVIVFSGLTMNIVKKSFDEGLGSSIKKLTGGKKNDELANQVMGAASDGIKLSSGSIIEISRLPGYVLQTKGDN